MKFEVLVEVRLRAGIADPQGATIERALPALGFDGVDDVRVGKAIRFSVDAADGAEAGRRAAELADRLLANPVIEDVRRHAWSRPAPTAAGDATGPADGPHASGVVVFPGSNCEHDVVQALGASASDLARLGAGPSWSGTASAPSPATTPWSFPAASPTATTCGPGPSPGSPR